MNILKFVSSVLMVASLLSATHSHAAALTPPSAQFVDKFGVNILNGQVNYRQATVSIGGPMGLSHHIALYSNHFQRANQRGYIDKYAGAAKLTQLVGPGFIWPIMRVHDIEGSTDFRIMGESEQSAAYASYVALKDPRHRLRVSGTSNEFLDWTKPDGTVTRFIRALNPRVGSEGRLQQITFPNGFKIQCDFLNRIHTNTGYSLVYQYEQDNRAPDLVADANAPAGAPSYSVAEWAMHNPRRVRAVNNAICSTGNAACLQRAWPTATFTWPPGMPRTLYIGRRVFTVDTPAGRAAYEYEPYDLAKNGDVVVTGYQAGQRISPRLRSIKPVSSQVPTLEYKYKNLFIYTSVGLREDFYGILFSPPSGMYPSDMGSYATLVQDAGVIESARFIGERNNYEMGQVYMHESSSQNLGSLKGGIWRVITTITATPPMTSSVDTNEAQIVFEPTARNFPTEVRHHIGVTESYIYTPNGNVKTVYTNADVTSSAVYAHENECARLPLICNQITSIRDAKNNETRYEYHAASGQVSKVTPPADQNGKVAQVRYDYQALRARYFDHLGNWVQGDPIYMKVAERHCHDSNYASEDAGATCLGGDEVVTRYHYNHDNLLLTSVATTSGGKTLRTCFQYDVYGNKLGETQPKGASSCS